MDKFPILSFADFFLKITFKFNGTPKNWRYQPKIPVLIQCHFETQTAQYVEPRNTPEINENHI